MPGDDPVEPIVKHAIELAETLCRPMLERAQAHYRRHSDRFSAPPAMAV